MSRRASLAGALLRGTFPHQLSWLIDNPIRALLISPKTLADRAALRPDDSVLELGSGSGFFSEELARRVAKGRLLLVDLQPEMLAKARRRGLPAHAHCAAADAAQPLPLRDGSLDAAVLVAVLGEVPAPATCLATLAKALRPGGRLLIHEHVPDPDFISPARLDELVIPAGFLLERRTGPSWNYSSLYRRDDG